MKHYTDIPLNDPKVFKQISTTDNVGLFQISSSGMSELMNRLKPQNIHELGTIISLYRPGPLNSGVTKEYIRRKESGEITYRHPKLEPILKDTLGLFIYQEQVIATCIQLASFTETEADSVRKMMGKKDKEALPKLKEKFIKGCEKNKIEGELIWKEMETFAGYGFNYSHAIGYAHITYYTAYLKTHHPVQFYAALFNTAKDSDELQRYITDAIKNKIEILLPDIIKSSYYFKPENEKIRYGLKGVYSVGQNIAQEIKGKSHEECLGILPKDNLEYLIKAGAFDLYNPNRKELLTLHMKKKPKKNTRRGLFTYETRYNIKSWGKIKTLREQFKALRVYLNESPLSIYVRKNKERYKYFWLKKDFGSLNRGAVVRTVGTITKLRTFKDRKGRTMAKGEYMDVWNQKIECIFFSQDYEILNPQKRMYEITGTIQDPNKFSLIITDLERIKDE